MPKKSVISPISISQKLALISPDFVVIYGDRFETFAAAIAATQNGIATVHIEGGDVTEGGALDDTVRHAITKLSHLHFTTNEEAAKRIKKLGEEKWRIKTVGLPNLDKVIEREFATLNEIETNLEIKIDKPIILFTQHSITTDIERTIPDIEASISALKHLASEGCSVLITYPNEDEGSKYIIERIERIIHPNISVRPSLGRYFYHGVLGLQLDGLAQVVCVGNSSSGVKETPIFKCPAVNIGKRQDRRLSGENLSMLTMIHFRY